MLSCSYWHTWLESCLISNLLLPVGYEPKALGLELGPAALGPAVFSSGWLDCLGFWMQTVAADDASLISFLVVSSNVWKIVARWLPNKWGIAVQAISY